MSSAATLAPPRGSLVGDEPPRGSLVEDEPPRGSLAGDEPPGGSWLQPVSTGILVAVVGFASSFTIVLAGLARVGATPAQAAEFGKVERRLAEMQVEMRRLRYRRTQLLAEIGGASVRKAR